MHLRTRSGGTWHDSDSLDLTAAFHLFTAERRSARRVGSSRHHTHIARAILAKFPNVWLEGVAALQDFCADYMSSSFDTALEAAREAFRLSTVSGHHRTRVAALANLGSLHLSRGEFDDAWRCLEDALTLAEPGGEAHIALLDSCADVKLAQRDWPACEALITRMQSAVAELSLSHPDWHERWCVLTRLRMLQQQGHSCDSLDLARTGAALAAAGGDEPMLRQFRFLQAAAHIARDEFDEATTLIGAAAGTVHGRDAWALAEVERLQGLAAARLCDIGDACDHFERGLAVLAGTGHTRARLDAVEDYAASLWMHWYAGASPAPADETIDDPVPGLRPARIRCRLDACSPLVPEAPRSDAGTLQAVAGLLDLAPHPAVFGEELLRLLHRSGCLDHGALSLETGTHAMDHLVWCGTPESPGPDTSNRIVRIQLEADAGRRLELALWPRPSFACWMTCMNVARLARAALAPEGSRPGPDAGVAAWPLDEPAEAGSGVFASQMMLDLLATARRIAPTTVTVLLTGESGTGKEVLARVIHEASRRASAAFVPFNCTSVPRDMVESQLFGYRRGAFTGAADAFPGVIRGAEGGTLFLDEIGDLTQDVQPKLLRFLDSSEVHPLGETQPVHVNVRVIAATNADLGQLVLQGRFREDLFYRLNVVHLRVPPLRERREEIPVLTDRFLRQFAEEFDKPGLRIADETLEYLLLYNWPGNVRQLAHEMRRLAALAEPGAVLMPEHLSPELAASRRTVPATERTVGSPHVVVRLDQPLQAAVEHVERAVLQHALAGGDHNQADLARDLGLSRKGLYLKRQRLGL